MDGKDFYKFAKICNDNQITIYPKHCNSGKYKIIVNSAGIEKLGTEIYEDHSVIREKPIVTPSGIVKMKEQVPSVWDKISELYKTICLKNNLIPVSNENTN